MKTYRLGVVAVAATCLFTGAFAQSATGNWNGTLKLDAGAIPKAKTPEQQKMTNNVLAMLKKMKFSLNLAANKTWKITVTGLPQQAGKSSDSDTGTWTQSGNTITLKSKKQKGEPQKLTVSKDGKTLTLTTPKGGGPSGAIIFKRA